MIQEGYLIPFISPPPLTGVPIDISSRHPAMSEVISSLLKKNAIESVLNPNFRGFYSRLFLVPKKDGKWRPVIDLSALNLLIPVDKFKMESTRSIRVAIRKGDWAVSLDLTDAFYHIPIASSSRKYLRFVIEGEVLQFQGSSLRPQVRPSSAYEDIRAWEPFFV